MNEIVEPLKPDTVDAANVGMSNMTYDIEYTEEELNYYATVLEEPVLEHTPYDFNNDMVCIQKTQNPFKRYWSHFCGRRIKFFIDQYEKWGDYWVFIDENYVAKKMSENVSN